MAHRSDTLIRLHVEQVKDKPFSKNLFLSEYRKSHVLSLFSLALHCSFSSHNCVYFFFLCWIGSFSFFCSVRFLYCSFSLSPYMLGTLSEEEEGQKKKKDRRRRKTENPSEQKSREDGQSVKSKTSVYLSGLV